jgi:AcrR family transcriptional regulator
MLVMSGRGERTREHILDVAERLYGDEGVANVSMRRIRIASGQRNDGAVRYHFGDRDGVIRGLNERHLPKIQEIARNVSRTSGRRPTNRGLIEVLTRPWADYVARGQGERAYVMLVAELLADPEVGFETMREHTLPELEAAGVALFERLSVRMPSAIATERVWTVSRFVIQTAADRARLIDDPQRGRPILPDNEFTENLIAMAAGALSARYDEVT